MRRFVVVLGSLLALAAMGGPAFAVGTDGVDMRLVLPQGEDGRMVLQQDGAPAHGEVLLRNLSDEPRAVTLYAVAATREEGASTQLASRGSAPWIDLPEETIHLAPGAEHTVAFSTRPRGAPAADDLLMGIVLESRRDATLITQAVGLVRVEGPGAGASWGWIWYLVAGALLLLVAAGNVRELRAMRRRSVLRPALA
jgi:hypothetical protein